jgi:hypothetical protein
MHLEPKENQNKIYMATVDVVISGFLYHGKSGAGTPVTITGIAGLNDLQIGGGPIYPPSQPPSGGPPGTPTFPIWGPPGFNPPGPGYPPGIGGGPIIPPSQPPSGGAPGVPTFPIWGPPGVSLPPGSGYPPIAGIGPIIPPDQPPAQPVVGWEAKAGWTPETGWFVAVVPKPGTEVPTPS